MIQIAIKQMPVTDSKLYSNAEISINGHAGWAVKGKDIVCAAVSVLYNELATYLRYADVVDDGQNVTIKTGWMDEGDVRLMEAFEGTTKQLAREYPNNVRLTVDESNG